MIRTPTLQDAPRIAAVHHASWHAAYADLLPAATNDRKTPEHFAEKWQQLTSHALVGEARIVGLIGALELVKDKTTRQFFDDRGAVGTLCRDICFDSGLVMRAIEDTMVISPPLCITREEIDELINLVIRCLDQTAKQIH
jgi:putrescine aminotransferase